MTVSPVLASKLMAMVYPGLALKLVDRFFYLGLKIDSYDLVVWVLKLLRQFVGLSLKNNRATVYWLRHKISRVLFAFPLFEFVLPLDRRLFFCVSFALRSACVFRSRFLCESWSPHFAPQDSGFLCRSRFFLYRDSCSCAQAGCSVSIPGRFFSAARRVSAGLHAPPGASARLLGPDSFLSLDFLFAQPALAVRFVSGSCSRRQERAS
jgi:hypothetical protein